jgi:hypothetical protein
MAKTMMTAIVPMRLPNTNDIQQQHYYYYLPNRLDDDDDFHQESHHETNQAKRQEVSHLPHP